MRIINSWILKFWFPVVLIVVMGGKLYASQITEDEDSLMIKGWINYDPEADSIAGISLNKAYDLLQGRPSKPVLVAIIDSGFDIDHEDLKDHIWVNGDEVPDNNRDDDENGYVDDVYGWNFIGGADGNVIYDTYELTREYKRLKPKYGQVKNGKGKDYQYWLKVKNAFESNLLEAEEASARYNALVNNVPRYYNLLKNYLDADTLTVENIASITSPDSVISQAAAVMGKLIGYFGNSASPDKMVSLLNGGVEHYSYELDYGYNLDYDPRYIVGDDYNNTKQHIYGNNEVWDYSGMMGSHGTHVAGIIGAIRDNHIGAEGIADNVMIMPVRTIPNGDERDKDVANAIYYAVNNGARVINMSFGKSYSPGRAVVEKALRYADKKGVLIVHAAGNDAENKDTIPNYPTREYIHGKKEVSNMIEVAASSMNLNERLPASFTNYGKHTVDLFAPGVLIYSTVPGNKYRTMNGTSMASPVVSGVAALLMSYFPELSAAQIKKVILESTEKYDGDVFIPGTQDKIPFSELSITGGIINAYKAVKFAQNMIRLNAR